MSVRSQELRAALRAYVAYRQNIENDASYGVHMTRLVEIEERYGRERARRFYRRYHVPVTIMIRDGITYRRL